MSLSTVVTKLELCFYYH